MAGRCLIIYEQSNNKEEALKGAVEKINEGAEGRVPELILFFSSPHNFYYHASRLYENYPESTVIGSSSCVCLSSCGFGPTGLTVLAVYDGVDVVAGVIEDVTTYPLKYAPEIAKNAEKIAVHEDTICLEFSAALLNCEEIVLDTLREGLKGTDIPVFGSSSGLDPDSIMTYVALNGEVYNEGCVYALIHNELGKIKLVRENMYRPTIVSFTVTDVDLEDRKIYEIDGKNAVTFLSEKLGIRPKALKDYFFEHPLGRVMDGDVYTVSVNDVDIKNGALCMAAGVYNRTKIVIMDPRDDFGTVWRDTATDAMEDGNFFPAFSIVVNCAARTEYMIEHRMIDEFNDALTDNYKNFIGCSGMGEQLEFKQLNHSMIMALFE